MSEVMEQDTAGVVEAPAKERKYTPLSDVEKQAATLRRDATLLRKYGNETKAAELEAQANQLAPEKPKVGKVDPLTAFSPEDQAKIRKYFECSKDGFTKLAPIVGYKKLAAVIQG